MRGRPGALLTGVVLAALLIACGAPARLDDVSIGVTERRAVKVDTEWPKAATAEELADTTTAEAALHAPDGARVRVRALLLALPAPCPACNVGSDRGQSTAVESRVGSTVRPAGRHDMPGCAPCPPAAATFADALPTAPPYASPLRATGAAEALQPRHRGQAFVLTGTFHANGAEGPEVEVTDVRAIVDH